MPTTANLIWLSVSAMGSTVATASADAVASAMTDDVE